MCASQLNCDEQSQRAGVSSELRDDLDLKNSLHNYDDAPEMIKMLLCRK